MISGYLKIAIRNLVKQKMYAVVNITGIALAFTSAIFITIYVIDEFSFDSVHPNPDLVLTMKIENEKVRVDAIATGLLKTRGHASNLNYIIEIRLKDNKYKFELVSLTYENTADHKKIPNFKTDSKMIKNFGTTPVDIEKYFNGLN